MSGTPDCPAVMDDGRVAVIDRKVVAVIQPATALQTTAYRLLALASILRALLSIDARLERLEPPVEL